MAMTISLSRGINSRAKYSRPWTVVKTSILRLPIKCSVGDQLWQGSRRQNAMHDAFAVSSSHFLDAIISACQPHLHHDIRPRPADQRSIQSRV